MNLNSSLNDERDEDLAFWEITILSLILLITLIGNSLILFALYLRRYNIHQRKLTRMYFFVIHLSIADVTTGLFSVLPQLIWDITFRFQGGNVLCKTVKFFQPLGNYSSSYILIATALDRYHAICYPLSYCQTTSSKSRIMVYSAWFIAFILCIPQLYIFSYKEINPQVWDCWATFALPYGQQIYVTWFSITVFLLPFIVLLFTYISICIKIWNFEIKEKLDEFTNKNREPLISRAKLNTVKQMIIVVSVYVITSSPFIGCQLWSTWDANAPKTSFFQGPAFTILALLSSLTSCVNPWIFLAFNSELYIILINYTKKKLPKKFNRDKDCQNGNRSKIFTYRFLNHNQTSNDNHQNNQITIT